MSDVEGVTAEETTVQESVENETPKTKTEAAEPVEETTGEPAEGEDSEAPQDVELSDEDIEKLKSDPKVKALLDKEIKTKTEAQKNALKHSQQAIERRNDELKAKEANIEKLQERIAEYQAKETQPLNEDDFETVEEFEAAQRKQDLKDEIRNEKLEDAKAELNAQMQEKVALAGEAFKEKEAEVIAANPDYAENTAVVQEYIDMIPKGPNGQPDAGFQEFSRYIAFECENGPALLNHLGKHPDKIEALLGKPPALIKRKLQGYDKELSAPKETPAPQPLPEPPKKAKGASTKNNLDSASSVLDHLGLRG